MSLKLFAFHAALYLCGLTAFLLLISEPLAMSTYFSDNSLLPGLVNREFSLATEAEYYLRDLNKLTAPSAVHSPIPVSLSNSPNVVAFIKQELDNFGLDVHEQYFAVHNDQLHINGTNIYSIIRGERSTNSEAILLCAPYRKTEEQSTLASVALTLSIAKYFSSKSYWAKDVIILFVDHDYHGASAWLDSYYDVNFKQDLTRGHSSGGHDDGQVKAGIKPINKSLLYHPLAERSGPLQAAIVLELIGTKFARLNVKIQGHLGQLPNLDLFNLVVEIAARESVTPYFYNRSFPFNLDQQQLYQHHLETALTFIKTQGTMQADGLHGLFLRYAVQALTLEGPPVGKDSSNQLTAGLLNVGRLVEGIFRSLNNLTERFNRSYYFYMIVSLRRFVSIGFYMIPLALMVAPLLTRALSIYLKEKEQRTFIGFRTALLLATALCLSLVSTLNISSALVASVLAVPILIII